MFNADAMRRALADLGELLEARGHQFEIVVVGGGGLLLAGLIERPTLDVDALAIVRDGEYQLAEPMPEPLRAAVKDVSINLGLAEIWLNAGPTHQLRQGLPGGFETRVSRLLFGGLAIQVASRFDQIFLKLYAAADHAPGSKHVGDLLRLAPTTDELAAAASWVKEQDQSSDFARFVDAVVTYLGDHRAS